MADGVSLSELLSDGLFVDGDWVESKDQDPEGEVRLIQLADVGDGEFRDRSARFLTAQKAHEMRCTFLERGDILVARMPEPLGRACIFPGVAQSAVTAVDVCVIRPNRARVRPEWLVRAINAPSFRSSMDRFVRGTTRQRISRKNLGTLRLCVPSLAEQLEAVRLLEHVETKASSALGHTQTALAEVGRLRQALFLAGCSGRLTADLRASAHEERSPVRTSSAAGSELESTFRRSKRKDELSENQPPAYELPATWRWARLRDLTSAIQYGYTASSTTEPVGPKMLRITDIQDDAVDWSTVPHCAIDAAQIQKFQLRRGDLVFARTGATTGKSFLVGDDPPDTVFASYLIRVRVLENMDPDYVYGFFRSAIYWQQILHASIGTGQPNVNGSRLAALWVPVPGLEEQREIGRRVARVLARIDALRMRLLAGEQRVARMSHAALGQVLGRQVSGGV